MIVDYRAYTFEPGAVPTFLQMFEEEGLEIQQRICGRFLGIFRTEVGNLNEVIQLWGYDNLAERERRRKLLFEDEQFLDYAVRARKIIVSQEVRILEMPEFAARELIT